jgi:menaquinone-dependent protoporphyrinogen IX oxidase
VKKRAFIKTSILGIGALALHSKASALEYYPNESDKKWAVLYGTWCGSSRDAGVWISEGMDGIANVFDVRENPDLTGYDYIVVGGSIRGGQTTELLQDYMKKNQAGLKAKIRGLYVVCGNRMQPPGPEQMTALIDNHLAQLCGVSGVPSKVFLGRITYSLLDPDSRKMMQSMNMPEYDNLKREECMAFGKEILESV